MDNQNRHQAITEFANNLVNHLKDKAPSNTGNLRNSITAQVGDDEILILAASYAQFVDKGINGKERNVGSPFSFKDKMPPIASLRQWANSKNINPYALQKSIFKKGVKGTGFLTNNINDKMEEFADLLADAVWEDFADQAKKSEI